MISSAIVELAWVGLVPLAAAAAVMLAARRYALPPRVAWAASVAAAYVVGQLGLAARVRPSAAIDALLWPHEARDWLPWLVLLAAGVAVLAAFAPRSWRPWVLSLAGLVALAAPVRLLAGSVHVAATWSVGEKLAHLALLAASVALAWLLLDEAEDDVQPRLRAALLVVVAVAAAVTLALSGSFTYGELAGVVAAALAGVALPAMMPPPARNYPAGLGGASGVLVMSLGSLLVLGHFYSELSAANAALLALAMIAAAGRLPRLPIADHWQPVIRLALCLGPLAWAVARAATTG